jgi:hypothetical protein
MVLPRALPSCSKEAKTRAPKGTQPPRDQAKAHSAKVPEQDGIKLLLKAARQRLPRLSYLRVDAGYHGRGKEWTEQELGLRVEVVRRTPRPIPEKIAMKWAQEWAKEGNEIDWNRLLPRRGFEALPRR